MTDYSHLSERQAAQKTAEHAADVNLVIAAASKARIHITGASQTLLAATGLAALPADTRAVVIVPESDYPTATARFNADGTAATATSTEWLLNPLPTTKAGGELVTLISGDGSEWYGTFYVLVPRT